MIGTRIVTAGIALLIVLPVLRVFLMLVVFVRERDFRFSRHRDAWCWRSCCWDPCWVVVSSESPGVSSIANRR